MTIITIWDLILPVVIARSKATKQSHFSDEIATLLSVARNDSLIYLDSNDIYI